MHTWTTKNGDILEISKMDTSHIQNCIKLLEPFLEHNREVFYKLDYNEREPFTYAFVAEPTSKQVKEHNKMVSAYKALCKELDKRMGR